MCGKPGASSCSVDGAALQMGFEEAVRRRKAAQFGAILRRGPTRSPLASGGAVLPPRQRRIPARDATARPDPRARIHLGQSRVRPRAGHAAGRVGVRVGEPSGGVERDEGACVHGDVVLARLHRRLDRRRCERLSVTLRLHSHHHSPPPGVVWYLHLWSHYGPGAADAPSRGPCALLRGLLLAFLAAFVVVALVLVAFRLAACRLARVGDGHGWVPANATNTTALCDGSGSLDEFWRAFA